MKQQVVKTFSWHPHCKLALLVDAERYLPAMLEAIAEAKQHILLEMYLVKPGVLLSCLSLALQQAAIRGVRCYLLLDDFGSKALQEAEIGNLQHDNILIRRYNPLTSYSSLVSLYRLLWQRLPQDLRRTHRKLLLIDGQTAFTGGMGICDEFSEDQFGPWRETMAIFSGHVVNDWQALFCDSWPEPLTLPQAPRHQLGMVKCQLTAAYAQHYNPLQQSIGLMCQQVQQRLWLCTAYFVPGWRLRRELIKAVKRGVDVRLLLPGARIDHPAIRHTSRRLYTRLLRHGVKIYEYQPRFLHTKLLLCDNKVSMGSSNFDRWGMRWNMEANLQVDSTDFADQVAAVMEQDFSQSNLFDYHRWCQRSWRLRIQENFWGWVSRLLTRLSQRLR